MAGTRVQEGSGHMLALSVGDRSEWGKLMSKFCVCVCVCDFLFSFNLLLDLATQSCVLHGSINPNIKMVVFLCKKKIMDTCVCVWLQIHTYTHIHTQTHV